MISCLPLSGTAMAQTAGNQATGQDAARAATTSVGPSTWNDLADTRGASVGALLATNSLLPGATTAAPQNPATLDLPKPTFLYPMMSDGLVQASAQGHVLLTPDTPVQNFRIFVPVLTDTVNMRLYFRNTIDILPEKSSVQVVVNDRMVGQISPRNFKGFAPLDIELPRDVLKSGENKVTLRAELFHRIACSPETTFSLQVELDPSKSGVSTDVAADPSKIDNPMPLILATALATGQVELRTS
ncbi:MAG: hypothetical protein EBU97_07035, partial [Rhodobacteraceae bacterium]|nr:hypothetical protein [Paracoccaceae bacterium]